MESIQKPTRLLRLGKSVMKIMWVLMKKVMVPKDTETSWGGGELCVAFLFLLCLKG